MIAWQTPATPTYAQYTFTETYSSLFVSTRLAQNGAQTKGETTKRTIFSAATRGLTADTTVGNTSESFDTQQVDTSGTSQINNTTAGTATGTGGTSTTAVTFTGVTSLTSASSSSFTAFASEGGVIPKTSSHAITTTILQTRSSAFVAITFTTTSTIEAWTTSSISDTDAETTEMVFTTLTATQSTTKETYSSFTWTDYNYTIEGTSTNVGLWNTIYLTTRQIDFEESRYTHFGPEILLALNQTYYADTWDGQDLQAQGKINTYERFTIEPFVTREDVAIYDGLAQLPTYLFSTSYSFPVTYDLTSLLTNEEIESEFLTVADYAVLPNTTANLRDSAYSVEKYSTESAEQSYQTIFNHYGNIKTFHAWVPYLTTRQWIAMDGQSYKETLNTIHKIASGIVLPSYTTFADGAEMQGGGGNTTIAQYRQVLGIVYQEPRPPGAEDPYAGIFDRTPRCSVVKKYGAKLNGEFGYRITADVEEPPITEQVMAQLSRAINTTAPQDVVADANQASVSQFYERGDVSWFGRAIYSVVETSNQDWTVSEGAMTWTTTTEEDELIQETTLSAALGLEGEPREGVVAIKTVLGGNPESYATFYNYLPQGLWVDADGNYHTGDGNVTEQSGDASTTAYFQVPCVSIGNFFGLNNLNQGQITTISRNPLPRGAGEFAYNWTNKLQNPNE